MILPSSVPVKSLSAFDNNLLLTFAQIVSCIVTPPLKSDGTLYVLSVPSFDKLAFLTNVYVKQGLVDKEPGKSV
jgi:hypothetical protein